ncbi:MAG: L-lactate dehydrogenase [Lachnospiraceae bacterium]|nr:L-lactate dehydrogenase [Lachnospiraceae bacterium]
MVDITSLHNRKVDIIGTGNVGASIAYALTIRNLAREIVLIDKITERAAGEALDIQHGIPYMGISSVRAGDYSDCADCDLVVITAGRNRNVGETRLDLARDNVGIIESVVASIKPYFNRGVILMVANPVDVLTYRCTDLMGLPDGRVFGTGNILDSSRLVRLVSDYTGLNTEMIKASIVGEHGDGQIPIWSSLSIAGVPIKEYCASVGLKWNSSIRIDMENKVRGLGAEIIKGKGKTHYGIATCVCYIADAILNQRLTIAPVTSVLQGEYGVSDVSLSVPSIIGVNGIDRRLEEHWSDFEFERFLGSAENIKSFLERL